MNQIIECVPNFSEGRDLEKIEKVFNTRVVKDGKADKKDVELFLPAKKYTIVNTGSDKQFTASILGTDVNAKVDTNASKITVNIDDLDNENQIIVHAKTNKILRKMVNIFWRFHGELNPGLRSDSPVF